jgi:hypothetical protein
MIREDPPKRIMHMHATCTAELETKQGKSPKLKNRASQSKVSNCRHTLVSITANVLFDHVLTSQVVTHVFFEPEAGLFCLDNRSLVDFF